jgi:DNA-binding YbaB/EbfC family protein
LRDMRNLMKQAQQMQQRMAELQEKLQVETMEGTAGGGVVTATVNGKHELLALKIQPQVVDPEDVEMLEDLVQSAVNEAMRKMEERMQSEMGKLTGGLSLGGLF